MVSTRSGVGQEPVALGREALSPIHRNDECRGVLKGQEGAPALLGQWFSRQQTNQKRRVLKLLGLFLRPDATPASPSISLGGRREVPQWTGLGCVYGLSDIPHTLWLPAVRPAAVYGHFGRLGCYCR